MKDEDPLYALRTAMRLAPSAEFTERVQQRVRGLQAAPERRWSRPWRMAAALRPHALVSRLPATRERSRPWRVAAAFAIVFLLAGTAYLRWSIEGADSAVGMDRTVPSHTSRAYVALLPAVSRVSVASELEAVPAIAAVAVSPERVAHVSAPTGSPRAVQAAASSVSFEVLFSDSEQRGWRNLMRGNARYGLAPAGAAALVEIPTLEFPILYPELATTEGAQK